MINQEEEQNLVSFDLEFDKLLSFADSLSTGTDIDIDSAWDLAIVQSNLISFQELNNNDNKNYNNIKRQCLLESMFTIEDKKYLTKLDMKLFNKERFNFWRRILSGAMLVNNYHINNNANIAIQDLKLIISSLSKTIENVNEINNNMNLNYSFLSNIIKDNINENLFMISMYSYHIFRIFDYNIDSNVETFLLHDFFMSSFDILLLSSKSLASNDPFSNISINSDNDDINMPAKLSLHIISLLFSRALLIPNIVKTIFENSLIYFQNIFKILENYPPRTRNEVAKRLISPLLKIAPIIKSSEEFVDLLWDFCVLLFSKYNDLSTCSIIICNLLNVPSLKAMKKISKSNEIWEIVTELFQQDDAVVRKRAAFILQNLPKSQDSPTNSLSGKRPWWLDYLDVYNQIEGCSSLHLMTQIWPLFDHLCMLSFSDKKACEIDNLGYPLISFTWIKCLMNVIFKSSLPPIRKVFLLRLFRGVIPFYPNLDTINWLCGEVIPMVDSVMYYSTFYVDRNKSVGCSSAVLDSEDDSVVGNSFGLLQISANVTDCVSNGKLSINATSNPCVLFPYFLTRIIHKIDKQEIPSKNNLLNYLIKCLLNTLCGDNGISSICAIQWIFRFFADKCNHPLITRCLGLEELRTIKIFLQNKFASSNVTIRDNIQQGIIPLLLKGSDINLIGLLPLLRMIVNIIGLSHIISDSIYCPMLQEVIMISLRSENYLNIKEFQMNSIDDLNLLSIGRSLLITPSKSNPDYDLISQSISNWDKNCQKYLIIASRLYGNPYTALINQQESIYFIHGIINTLSLCIENNLSKNIVENFYSSSIITPFIPFLQNGGNEISCYFYVIIKSAITDSNSLTPTMSSSPINKIEVLDKSVEILGSLMLIPKLIHNSDGNANIVSIVNLLSMITKYLSTPSLSTTTTDDAVVSIQHILCVRCASILLPCVHRALPLGGIDTDNIISLLNSLTSICSTLLVLPNLTSNAHKNIANYIVNEYMENTLIKDKSSLYLDLFHSYEQFSKCADMYLDNKWKSIRFGLEIIAFIETNLQSSNKMISIPISNYYNSEKLLSLSLDQIDVCTVSGISDLIGCILVAIKKILPKKISISYENSAQLLKNQNNISNIKDLVDHLNNTSIESNENILEIIRTILSNLWCVIVEGCEYLDVKSVYAFIYLVFDNSLLSCMDFETIQDYYNRIFELGNKDKPHISRCLVSHLCSIWSVYPALSVPFFPVMNRLILYKEPKRDDFGEAGLDDCTNICRIMILQFFESLSLSLSNDKNENNNEIKVFIDSENKDKILKCLHHLILNLVNMNNEDKYIVCSIIGNETYGEKLRCWQALCIMSDLITEDLLLQVVDTYYSSLKHVMAHSIRVHMEIFGTSMVLKFRHIMLPKLFDCLKEFNHPQQTLASYYMILGYFVEAYTTSEPNPKIPILEALDKITARSIIDLLMPWLSCASGLPRSIAQMVIYMLIPIVIEINDNNDSNNDHFTQYLLGIYEYLEKNSDSYKIIIRQKKFFKDYSLSTCCTVLGLMSLGCDNSGEIVPDHMLAVIVEMYKSNTAAEKTSALLSSNTVIENPAIVDTNLEIFQTKIIPFDSLRLYLEEKSLSRCRNSTGRKRQSIVICASLIDKAINLAGIARTCEIFAMEQLVIPNKSVLKTDEFKGISVSAEQWLPINECSERNLPTYLHNMKKKGYTIVGLEQTSSSSCLSSTTMPSRCVLVLGKEKEGIPVEIMLEVDLFIEIPQLGVIRSLNVHVSCALAIWEMTKQNIINNLL
jgi:tRNA(Leu) C34 or U34 (ribose-2'-O)-methylase TrmL